jgi:hypothetical protein
VERIRVTYLKVLGFRVSFVRIKSCGKNSGDLFESFRV